MVAPQASLQRRILGRLLGGPRSNIANLGRELNASRPAASRALHALKHAGLVSHEGRGWSITPLGRDQLRGQSNANAATLRKAVERTIRTETALSAAVGAAFGRQSLRQLESAARAAEAMMPSPSILDQANQVLRMTDAMMPSPSILDQANQVLRMTDAMMPFAQARATALSDLSLQVSALANTPAWWSPVLANSLTFGGQIAADLAVMTNATTLRPNAKFAGDLQSVVGRVLDSHHVHLSSALIGLAERPMTPSAASLITRPTDTTARFTRVARDAVVPAESDDPAELMERSVMALAHDLESLGARQAAQDLRAAWSVILRRDPGWSKAGAHLMREVLRCVLDELAPHDRVPPNEEGKPTKRAQIMWIVDGNETLAAWADATTSNVGKLHSLLSAEAKNTGQPRVKERGILGLLHVTVGVVTVLIEQAADRDA